MRCFCVGILLTFGFSVAIAAESFSLEDFLTGKFSDTKWNGTWYSDTEILFPDNEHNYKLFDVSKPTQKATTFLAKSSLEKYKRPSITSFTKDKKYVLVRYEAKAVYRHSSLAKFAVLRHPEGTAVDLPVEIKDTFLQTCRFSPVENSLIAVKGNSIYYISNFDPAAPATTKVTKVTNDVDTSAIYNGVPDWIYEEEVIAGESALWPSPTSSRFIFAKFDDTKVENFMYPFYGKPGEFENQYPKWVSIRYPKVGTPNPKFSLIAYNPADNIEQELVLKLGFDSTLYVLYDVAWRTEDKVLVTYTNRAQTEATTTECNVKNGVCNNLATKMEATGWLDILPVYVAQEAFIDTQILNGFDALRVITSETYKKVISLGNMTVSRIIGFGKKCVLMMFEGTEANNHSQQQVYGVNLDKADLVKCITCDFKVMNQTCKHSSAEISPGGSFMTRICSGPGPTFVDIIDIATGKVTMVWLDNANVRDLLAQKKMPVEKNLLLDIPNSDGLQAAVRLLLPPGLSESSSTKYPMLVNVYAGPNSNQIADTYSIGLQHYLVTEKNYIYAFIDGRGSGKRGRKLMHKVYKNLGGFEIDDQIAVTKMLRDKFSYIDATRIGIWGWSYGGYATAHALARDNGTFTCGVSVAPVTDFIYYDSIYTERYMGVYDDKDEAVKKIYEQTDVTKVAAKFRGKNFLLVHGNADDNVHYQQAMQLARALEQADVPFEQMSYPDEAHSLGGVKKHLYHMVDAYWSKHFEIKSSAAAEQRLNTLCKGEYKKICCIVFRTCD